MEHYDTPDWQPYPIVAALGACVILVGVNLLVAQLVISIRRRCDAFDATGDPWDGRTLEWLTSSPPAPYNFAVVPQVHDLDAFFDLKRRGIAYQRPAHYSDILMPRNTGIGVIVGGLAFTLGFAMVWHIWSLAIGSALAILVATAVRSFEDDIEYRISAAEVAAIEDLRLEALAQSPRPDLEALSVSPHRPLPRGAT